MLGDISSRCLELIDTGSTGRGTNIPGDGDFDFMLRVVTDNTQSLEHLLNLVKSIPGVQNTRTILILSSVKEEHSVDPDELLK